jgi:hypothetical protein
LLHSLKDLLKDTYLDQPKTGHVFSTMTNEAFERFIRFAGFANDMSLPRQIAAHWSASPRPRSETLNERAQ